MTDNFPAHILDWDSRFWGIRTARVADGPLGPAELVAVDQWSADNEVRFLYYLCRGEDGESSIAAQAAGFFLTDIRLTLTVTSSVSPSASSAAVRPAVTSDIGALRRLAATCHTNTRFSTDPRIAPTKRAALYETWVERDVIEAPLALVIEDDRGICGYVTGTVEHALGSIGLFGVAPATRSAGHGGALLDAALRWFAQMDIGAVRVITQGANVPAQRLYQSRGFRTSAVGLWFHKWYDRA